MSHATQMEFVELLAGINGDLLPSADVLEVGAYDVNGSIRSLFATASSYLGVDLVEGPGVDLVSYGHELQMPEGTFDIAISCECFEHDVHWVDTFVRMAHLTRSGGLVAFTCASRARPEHGTRRTSPNYSPGTQDHGSDYYRNLTRADVEAAVDLAALFDTWFFAYQKDTFDLYFAGVRKGEAPHGAPSAVLPGAAEMLAVSALVPWPTKVKGSLLRTLRSTSSEQSYQARLIGLRQVRTAALDFVGRGQSGVHDRHG